MKLTEFLSARIAEDESNPPQIDSGYDRTVTPTEIGLCYEREIAWDRRWLAECASKRKILQRHRPIPVGIPEITCRCCRAPWPCPDVRSLALPYADHPDYREWKP